jgi:hypothetical protein
MVALLFDSGSGSLHDHREETQTTVTGVVLKLSFRRSYRLKRELMLASVCVN